MRSLPDRDDLDDRFLRRVEGTLLVVTILGVSVTTAIFAVM
ncbi:hypothetical protein FHS85_005311 [Rhodoligotrophos appendicifer]|nr:hypothetical protein [Rhodoligotrophos appendicifer]